MFPGRLEVILGDSTVTVPAYTLAEEAAGRDPHAWDVVFIDGDHSEEGAYIDMVNFQARLAGAVILATDRYQFVWG